MIRVTQAQAAEFLLRKNHLAGAKAAHVGQAVTDLVGLPAGLTLTPFLAARSRMAGFSPDELRAELYYERRLIRAVLMRAADYIVSTADYPAWYAATRRQHNQAFNAEFRLWGLNNAEVAGLGEAVMAAVGQAAATVQTIIDRLPEHLVKPLSRFSRGGREEQTSNVALVLRWLTARGELAVGLDWPPPSDNWQVEELAYAPLNYWYPQVDLSTAPGEAEAQVQLVRAYLAAFGPANEADISAWTGLSKSETARAVGTLTPEMTLALVEGIPGMMLLLKEQQAALAAIEPAPEPVVNVLPADDSFVAAHRASRARLFSDPKLQRQVFSGSGAARPTIAINGHVVGVWAWGSEAGQEQINWRLLVEVDPVSRERVQAEMERLAAFIGPHTRLIPATP